MLVRLRKLGELHFRLFGTEGFYVKKRMKDLLLRVHVVVRTSKIKISRRHLADYLKNCTKKRVARAARLFFFVLPIKSLIRAIVVAVPLVIS